MAPGSTRLFLIRHGAVEDAWRGRIYGSLDIPLSDLGQAESTRAAASLASVELSRVISSGLQRTEHTASRLRAPRALERVDDPALREIERGDWRGLTPSELEDRWPGAWAAWFREPSTLRPPGGESLGDLFRRVHPRVDHWARAHRGRSIALVTHGWVVRVLVCHALGAPYELAPRLDVRTGDISILRWPEVESGRPELESFAVDRDCLQLSE